MTHEFEQGTQHLQVFGSETMTAVMAVLSVRIFGALVCKRFESSVDSK